MTKALTDLLAKVEAGAWPEDWREVTRAISLHPDDRHILAQKAHNGSLDAAKALHESVLPGWDIQITTYEDDSFEASVAYPLRVKTYDGISPQMSRSWLIAILKALIAKDQTND